MKFHETHYDEYIEQVEKHNFHPELDALKECVSSEVSKMGNFVMYGPSGVGKYSQVLHLIKKYSPSGLKYDKKMVMQTDKHVYQYRISDIHYEIDMALLGCNSKVIWHEVFGQIVDIISMKQHKFGIIICKNFHSIHTELLEIFYSYMQQCNHPNLNVQIKFILITEHVCFIPNNILQCSRIVNIKRPLVSSYEQLNSSGSEIEPECILNMKEIKSMDYTGSEAETPPEIFDIVCRELITQMENYDKMDILQFRDSLYDILVYNLDATECFWEILTHFIRLEQLTNKSISAILLKTQSQLKYYNNNYRPIYHLETLFITILNQIQSSK